MQLYSVSDRYINYLRKKFPRVYSNKETARVHTRKYLGMGDNKELKGTLQIGTMIPVPDTEIELYDVKNESDQAYKGLVNEEIIYIRKHKNTIIRNARVLYSKRKSGEENRVVQSCLDFSALEAECDKWSVGEMHERNKTNRTNN